MSTQRGYSIIELLVVIAIVGITIAVGLFAAAPATRASRAKGATTSLYEGLMRARSQAMIQNGDITVAYNVGTRTATFTQNGTVNNRIIFSNETADPGNPRDGADYHFEPLSVIRSQTREGDNAITGLDVDGDGAADNIPILSDGAVAITIQQNGFINGIGDASAILVMHQNDIDEGDLSGERQYAVIVFSTGLIKRARHMPDGTWELF